MITKYIFGTPFDTEAVVEKNISEGNVKDMPFFKVEEDFFYELGREDIIYGLGENVRGINKRGWKYESYAADDPGHTEEKISLYGAHNFFVVEGEKIFGAFFDFPGKIHFDMGYTKPNEIRVHPDEMNVSVYIITGESVKDIVKQFREIIGRSYIPPKWAFGYGQSRWGYETKEDYLEVVKIHRENHIPLDSIYMDIDYMESYKDFTLNDTFKDMEPFVEDLKAEGVHLVPIIDAGVKIEPGYDVYEEGVEKNYFCKNEEGEDFVAGVWPGRTHFPDVMNKEAREWFGNKYSFLLEKGIDGFWNDMNEPSIFFTDKNLKEFFEKMETYKGMNFDATTFFEFVGDCNLKGGEKEYREFFHNVDGTKVRHDKIHNLYGMNMTRAAGEAFDRLEPDKRILLFSRSSYVGMHRYGGVWMGDNQSWFSHILLCLQMLPSLNMCGFLYTGADLGGFGSDTTQELLMRFLALGIFTPLMRNHSAWNTRRQEIYQFEGMESMKHIIEVRYQLLPYLYSEYMKAALDNEMLFRPLSFDYPEDTMARSVEDQLLLGEGLMIAPVYTQNAKGRYVYLPEEMKELRFAKGALVTRVLPQGHHYIAVEPEEVVFFLRKDHILPLSQGGENVEQVSTEDLIIVGWKGEGKEYLLYEDDGNTKEVGRPEQYRTIKDKK